PPPRCNGRGAGHRPAFTQSQARFAIVPPCRRPRRGLRRGVWRARFSRVAGRSMRRVRCVRSPAATGREPAPATPSFRPCSKLLGATPIIALTVAGCSPAAAPDPELGVAASPRVAADGRPPQGGGVYKVGQPYKVAGRWYVPREDPAYDRTGVASWYGTSF